MSLPFLIGLRLFIRYLQIAATYHWKCGQAKKENELPVKEMCSANILCTQMLSAEWRQIGQKLACYQLLLRMTHPRVIKLRVDVHKLLKHNEQLEREKANSAVKDLCSEHSVYKPAAQRN